MENKIKMVARIAGEEVYVGECNSARARILVKRSYASWLDGKILLHILNVHDQLLANGTQNFRGPLDDENVSEREMERRLAWFRAFMVKATEALTPRLQRFPSVEEAEAWFQVARYSPSTKSVYGEFPGWESYYEDVPIQEATSLYHPEDFKSWEAYYKNPTYKEGLPPISSEIDGDFVSLWEPTLDVYAIFPSMLGVRYDAPTRAETTDIPEQEFKVVATLKQVLCYQHGPNSSEYSNFNARPENVLIDDEGSSPIAK